MSSAFLHPAFTQLDSAKGMKMNFIRYHDAIDQISWLAAMEALRIGHLGPRAEIADAFLGPNDATLLNRSAFIDGLGYGVKAVTVFRDNASRALPTTQGAMSIFDPDTGELSAVIDSQLITEFKTVSDSLLGASLLARPDSKQLLIVGGGAIAQSLVRAYPIALPNLEKISVWTRRPKQAAAIVAQYKTSDLEYRAVDSLESAVREADIISTATMARTPILTGAWVSPGTHVDLIGAFKADMREADDDLISSSSVFVDSRETTIEHIGELKTPIASGVLSASDIKGDLYDLLREDSHARSSDAEVTVFKNGGGAHLDLMIARYILDAMRDAER